MAKTVGDFLVERLRAWGVQRVFGYPGDGINGIMAGFEHAGDERPRFIQARHEELAALMAGAHAKFTGEPGGCLGPPGPRAGRARSTWSARPPRPPAPRGSRKRTRQGSSGAGA